MSRVLLVAATTGYQTRSFADAARKLGVEVTLATDRCHVLEDPWRDRALPIRFEEPQESAERLAATLTEAPVDGIVAVADRSTLIAALVAERLGLLAHPPRAVRACRNKHEMRERFAAAGLPVPANMLVPLTCDSPHAVTAVNFPCVLKPLGLSASRGVIRADDRSEFIAAFKRIRRILESPEIRQQRESWNEAIQVEDYIPGREFALEGLMTRGGLTVLAIFDKPEPLEGPFFEETVYVTPSRERAEVQQAIVHATRHAVEALGLWHGPVHAEMRVNSDGVWMLEVAARPIGGLCTRALRFENDLTLEELVILHAIGKMPDEVKPAAPASGVMMIPIPRAGILESVTGVENARRISGIDDVIITAKPAQKLVPLPEGASYLGFIFASGRSPEYVEDALRRAHGRVKFEILGTLEVVE